MKKSSFLFLLILAVNTALSQTAFQSERLVKVWTSSVGLKTPESACFHKPSNSIYVSNIAGKSWEKDSLGFISILNTRGEVENLFWVNGLHAPKGIAIFKNNLFVADVDFLLKIDLKSAKITARYSNVKAVNLNDVAIDKKGNVFVSDSKNKCIFSLLGDSLQVFLESEELLRLNGIIIDQKVIICGVQDSKLLSIDIETKKITVLSNSVPYVDGLVMLTKSQFITSNFKGEVMFIDLQKGNQKLLDTSPMKINAADLGFISEQQLLLVPTFNHNSVEAYKLIKE